MGLAATLAAGLRSNSRTMMKMSGEKLTIEESLLALLVDRVSTLCWQNTLDGYKGRNRPESLYSALTGIKEEKKLMSFETGEDFLKAWRET